MIIADVSVSLIKTVFCEDDPVVVLETVAMHAQYCQPIQTNITQPHLYGVKHSRLLNSLQYFNTVHDILKGVGQFKVKLVLQYIQDQLAGRMHAFDYGFKQQQNRPPREKLFSASL